jgi:PAS domain S-box-containing protein
MKDKSADSIRRVIAAVSHLVSAEEVAGVLVREVASTLGAAAARVGLFTESGMFHGLANVGYPPELTARWATRRLSESPVMQDVSRGQPAFAHRISADPRFDQEIIKHLGDGATLVVPMAVADKVIGFMSATFREEREFSVDEQEFALTLATHCGQSLERARLYEAERRAYRKLEAVLNQLPIAVVIVDRDGHTVLNEQVRAVYGTSLRTLNRKDYQPSVLKHLDGSDYAREEIPITRALFGEEVRGELVQIERADDQTLRTLTVSAGPVRDVEGAITSAVAAFADVTDEMRMQDQLRASERRYHAVLRATNDVIWELDPESGQVVWNLAFERVFGHSRDAAAKHPQGGYAWWQENLHPDDRTVTFESFERAMAEGATAWAGEYRFRCADGSYINMLDRCVVERDEQGRPLRVVGAMSDITEQKRLLNELREAVSVRDDFLSIAGHELRNPLAALAAQLEGIEQLPADDQRRAVKLAAAKRQVRRLSTLVDELLNVSRIVHGSMRLERERFDLSELVREVADRLAEDFARGGSPLRVDACGQVVGSWDRLRIDLVVSNLLSNALRYGQKQPVNVRVEADDAVARVLFEDRGIGIHPEDQARIFERFVRAAPVREYGGLGVGLWLARQIVDAHGGRLAVESQAGAGSRFTVELPR